MPEYRRPNPQPDFQFAYQYERADSLREPLGNPEIISPWFMPEGTNGDLCRYSFGGFHLNKFVSELFESAFNSGNFYRPDHHRNVAR